MLPVAADTASNGDGDGDGDGAAAVGFVASTLPLTALGTATGTAAADAALAAASVWLCNKKAATAAPPSTSKVRNEISAIIGAALFLCVVAPD